jgi:long-chain acyl-CoA synthetase
MNAIDVQSIAIDGFTTVPTLFWHRVKTKGSKVAMREKDRGIWKAYTWADYGARAKAVGMGLIALGLEPGDRVAILSDNNKEWLFCDLGVLCAAGVSTGIYPTDSPQQVEYLVNDSGTKFLLVEDEEQLDKILAVRERTPGLKKIIVFDMEGLRDLDDPQVMPLDDLYELGEAYARDHDAVWEERMALPKPGDVAIIVYTSGTTGPSKGALLTHRNIIFQGGAFACATSPSVRAAATTTSPSRTWSTSPRRPTRCRRICARWRPTRSSPCRGFGRSSIPASPSRSRRAPGRAASPTGPPSASA